MEVSEQNREMKGEKNNTWKTKGKKEEVAFIYSCHLLLKFVTTI
jgi:hypothetical protein